MVAQRLFAIFWASAFATLAPETGRTTLADPAVRGGAVSVQGRGHKSWNRCAADT